MDYYVESELPSEQEAYMTTDSQPGMAITADSRVEEIVEKYPKAVGWLVGKGVVCMVCGEPFWGTLGELMEKKRIENPEGLLVELNAFLDMQ